MLKRSEASATVSMLVPDRAAGATSFESSPAVVPTCVPKRPMFSVAAIETELAGRIVAEGMASDAMASPDFLSLLDARDIGARMPLGRMGGAPGPGRAAWIRADNVILASEAPRGLSARHVWPGTIGALIPEADGSVLATLKLEDGYILSRITAEAARDLALTVGGKAWAVVKVHAI